jgi:hypothetical protein
MEGYSMNRFRDVIVKSARKGRSAFLFFVAGAALAGGCATGSSDSTAVVAAAGSGSTSASSSGDGAGGASTSSSGSGAGGKSTSSSGGGAGGESSSSSGSGGAGGAGGQGPGDPTGITFIGVNNTAQRGSVAGGVAYDDACPAGQVVIGFSGFLTGPNGYHGRIQALCGVATLSAGPPYAITVSNGATLPLRGLMGATQWSSMCPTDQMVVGFNGRSGALIDQLGFRCAPILVGGSPQAPTLSIGSITDLPAAGGIGGMAFPTTDCPVGQVATVARIRAGDGIDAFGLACSTPELTF